MVYFYCDTVKEPLAILTRGSCYTAILFYIDCNGLL
ncbi:hypothetical protein CLOBOL_03018 [Enterocloster bolteae ATCC BAA-613]|uniref:Uncharacterized protein n=1 Tax=Enterocloster bolteae (strain ATCC BAA-613 / DSM 15670 / CCUG 46953 / JCM 12243 / WAL 16351) TaxID=411902 RepID=A8RRJ8_ENTBW|nr:hypothetical protein CLOBOL_03018 [Enterocloster bolteae ATCC BAA-613]